MDHGKKFDAAWYDQAYSAPYDTDRYLGLWSRVRRECDEPYSVLDLGCGTGRMLGEWNGPRIRVGADFSSVAIAQANKNYPGVRYVCRSFEDLYDQDGAERYDAVTLVETLEHIKDDVRLWRFACHCAKRCVVACVPYDRRVGGEAHTLARYTPRYVRERFGAESVEIYERDFLIFRWDRPLVD